MSSNLYKFPDLGSGAIPARLKRLERTTQFAKRGINADTTAKFRTVAAWQLDRDGNIVVGTGTTKAKTTVKSVAQIPVANPSYPVPTAPIISEELIARPLVLEFGFNYQSSTAQVPIDEYVIYKNSVNDPDAAIQWKTYSQPLSGIGQQIVQDTVGAGVVAYYWVTARGVTGESTKAAAQDGAVSALPSNNVMTTYRPSIYSNGGFSTPTAAYDNNLNSAAWKTPIPGATVSCTWYGFSSASGSPASISLKASWSATFANSGADATIYYSTDGGSTWNTAQTTSVNVSKTTTSVTLLTTQDLTQVRIKATADASGGGVDGTVSMYVYESWIEVVT